MTFRLKSAVVLAQKHFKTLIDKDVFFETKQVEIALGQNIELTEDIWEEIITSIDSVDVIGRRCSKDKNIGAAVSSVQDLAQPAQSAPRLGPEGLASPCKCQF